MDHPRFNLYIQDETPNVWNIAKKWESDFIVASHTVDIPRPASGLTIMHNDNIYITKIVDNSEDYICDNFRNNIENTGIFKEPRSFLRFFRTRSSTVLKVDFGFICNMNTGESRMYIFSRLDSEDMSRKYRHNGITKLCDECILEHYE